MIKSMTVLFLWFRNINYFKMKVFTWQNIHLLSKSITALTMRMDEEDIHCPNLKLWLDKLSISIWVCTLGETEWVMGLISQPTGWVYRTVSARWQMASSLPQQRRDQGHVCESVFSWPSHKLKTGRFQKYSVVLNYLQVTCSYQQ